MRFAESGSTPPLSARAVLRHDDADPVALDALDSHRGQRGEERRTVVLEDHPPVEQHNGAAIGLRADEPAVALAQPEGRERELVLAERIVVPLGPALDERVVRHWERQLRDDDTAELVAGQVDTLPERLRAEEHRAAGGEPLEDRAP